MATFNFKPTRDSDNSGTERPEVSIDFVSGEVHLVLSSPHRRIVLSLSDWRQANSFICSADAYGDDHG